MGYVDLHVHAAPDVVSRLADDLAVARGYAEAGYSACVLKSHYESTVGRAAVVSAALAESAAPAAGTPVRETPPLRVYGGVALNGSVGGFNPTAVAAALREGGRVIWLPTQDAHTQEAAGLPRLCDAEPRLGRRTYAAPPVDSSTEPALRTIFGLVAEADAVLATGHLSTPEVAWVLRTARDHGVRRLLVTHPGYTVPAMSVQDARECAQTGALLEVTAFQLLSQPGTADSLAGFVRVVGIQNVVLTSDAGQPESPPPVEALRMLIDALAGAGLDRAALEAAASERPAGLLL